MIAYRFRHCKSQWEATNPVGVCPECGSIVEWFGMVQRDSEPVEAKECGLLIQVPNITDSSPRYRQWYETEGKRRMALPDNHPEKLEPVRKDSDIMHV